MCIELPISPDDILDFALAVSQHPIGEIRVTRLYLSESIEDFQDIILCLLTTNISTNVSRSLLSEREIFHRPKKASDDAVSFPSIYIVLPLPDP